MASVSSKAIKTRIRSMESTKQITKAMEMVAASKLRRAQARISNSRPYFEILSETIAGIVHSDPLLTSPYIHKRPGNKRLYIVIAGDRGLAGGYNSNVLKMVLEDMADADATVLPIGKKALDYFRAKKIPLFSQSYDQAEDMDIGDCFSLAKAVSKAYLDEQYDHVILAYTHFSSVLSQIPQLLPLLPLTSIPVPQLEQRNCETIYENGAEEVFDKIVPEYLGGTLYGALSESLASEQAARRSAMDSATQNAEDMIADLSLKFNRARQAAITQEITEIVAGS